LNLKNQLQNVQNSVLLKTSRFQLLRVENIYSFMYCYLLFLEGGLLSLSVLIP
jgi:hypothetical protein